MEMRKAISYICSLLKKPCEFDLQRSLGTWYFEKANVWDSLRITFVYIFISLSEDDVEEFGMVSIIYLFQSCLERPQDHGRVYIVSVLQAQLFSEQMRQLKAKVSAI